MSMARRIIVTGAAGFVGYHVCRHLLKAGDTILGIDSLNSYYDPALKAARLNQLHPFKGFMAETFDLAEPGRFDEAVTRFKPAHIIHLAAQAGVRYSLENPRAYVSANVDGFLSVLEACRHHDVTHLIYASSSSVYGANEKVPFSEEDRVDHPVSLYAATKRANELMAQTYAHLFGIQASGLRFFTVYGPWGRPDMAYYSFTKAVFAGEAVALFNHGRMKRDFTYIDDVIEAIARLLGKPPSVFQPAGAPHIVYNIGNHTPVELERFVEIIGEKVGRPVRKVYRPMQPGDVVSTYADVARLSAAVDFAPSTPLEDGIERFVAWYRDYNKI